MPLLDKDFYPSTDGVIDQMLEPYLRDYSGRHYLRGVELVLEPSAGWGHICKRLEHYGMDSRKIRCIEKNEEARHVLMGEGYKVIDTDFLLYDDITQFSHIIMNPPFSMGCAHILKAWKVLRSGHIACQLNANTIRKPNSRARRTLAKLIKDHGQVKFIGQPYLHAERPTDAEVCIVWLEKKGVDSSANFSGMQGDIPLPDTEFDGNFLARADIIQSLVDQFNRAKQVLIDIDKAEKEYLFYTHQIPGRGESIVTTDTLDEKVTKLKRIFWAYVFDKTKIGQKVTSRFRDKFDKYAEGTKSLAFSVENINSVLMSFLDNADVILKECVLEVFDLLTAYHKENRIHVEGWASNKSWKVSDRVVLPSILSLSSYGTYHNWTLAYQRSRELDDLDRVLCHLSRQQMGEISTMSKTIERHLEHVQGRHSVLSFSDAIDSTFFRIRVYKKCTAHLWVKDRDLWDRFNIMAADGKGWLPGPS